MADKIGGGSEGVTFGGDTGMTAFIAGATGYTGATLVAELAGRGVRVVAHVRPDSARLAEWRARFNGVGAVVDTTPWEQDAMMATLQRVGPAVIFALLGTTKARIRADTRPPAAVGYRAVDYGLTALLLRAAMAAAPDARFVYLSSLGVRERTSNEYLRVRWELETELRQAGIPFTIVRPSFITGPDREERRRGERVAATAVDALLAAAGALGARRLRDRYASMTAAELARALARVAFDPAAAGRTVSTEELR